MLSICSLFTVIESLDYWIYIYFKAQDFTVGCGENSDYAFFFSFIVISWRLITLHYCRRFCHESAMDLHVFPIWIPPPNSLPTPSFCVFPVHQPWALVLYIQPGLGICFTLDSILVSMLFSAVDCFEDEDDILQMCLLTLNQDCTNGKELTRWCRRYKRCGFNSWIGKIPGRRTWQPTAILLPGEFHGQRSLVCCSP